MQERVREQGGLFEIRSDESGTTIEVNMPLSDVTRATEEQATSMINCDWPRSRSGVGVSSRQKLTARRTQRYFFASDASEGFYAAKARQCHLPPIAFS